MGTTDILVIGAVLVAGYFLFTHPEIIQDLTGNLGGGGSTNDVATGGEDSEAYAESEGNGETDIDVSGPGAGACANGVCKGNPDTIRRAQELLEEIQD